MSFFSDALARSAHHFFLFSKPHKKTLDSFLGVLYPTEDFNVYGHITSSGIKLILVIDDLGMDVHKIKSFLREFSHLYCDVVCNPFYQIGTPIQSKKFREKLGTLLLTLR